MTDKKLMVREGEEVWEATTESLVWMEVAGPDRTTKMINVQGPGNRLRLRSEDRMLYQERLQDPSGDVFTNGLLVRIDADQQADENTASPNALSDEGLKELFKYKQAARFKSGIDVLSEVSLRRLMAIAKDCDISAKQQEILREMLDTKFSVNKDYVDPGADVAASFVEQRLS